MRYLTFSYPIPSEYEIAFLVPQLSRDEIQKQYIDPYFSDSQDKIIAYNLHKEGKRTPVKRQKEYLNELLPTLEELGVKTLVVCDAEYFKTLSKTSKSDAAVGYVGKSAIGDFNIVYCPNFSAIFYDPVRTKDKINRSLTNLVRYRNGNYLDPGTAIIKNCAYPKTLPDIRQWLEKLLEFDQPLSCDIEGFSLKHNEAGIGTITFCWSKDEGVAFPVDSVEIEGATEAPYSTKRKNHEVRKLLKEFFIKFQNKIIYHNITYDVYVLIYQLFMDDLLNTEGLLYGLDVMLKNWDCTQLISYLATNTCAGNKLSLKDQAQEYAGDYAVDNIVDITKIPFKDLLQYNLIDGLSTWYVFEKNYPIMVADDQLEFYETIFKPAVKDIIQMQLTGLPINMEEVVNAKSILQKDMDHALEGLANHSIIQAYIHKRNVDWVDEKNAKLKKKRVSLADAKETFNPGSPNQLREILYSEDFLGLPVLGLTDKKLPSTKKKYISSLINHTDNEQEKELLRLLEEYADVAILLSTFIPAFEAAPRASDGWHYLFGFFRLGGTVSGRLSSNNPNLQNIPSSGTKYAKIIKRCFSAPKGWIFCGLDFASLEDRISALTTKDRNKLKVYTDGFDGHCLRAYYYFSDQLPNINPDSVDSINSIAKLHKSLRQDSKVPTFLLTYGGTWKGIVEQCGFSDSKAKSIEANYHKMYVESDEWVKSHINKACDTGYVTVAFGLRLRTPLLKQVILGNSKTPYEAEKEGRTAGNALGQSWGLLNNRAASEFMGKVRISKHRLDIRPCAHIHDAQYYLIREDIGVLHYMNEHLVKAVQWQEDPLIAHDEVKLGGEVSVFYPDWSNEIEIPNGANQNEILEICKKGYQEYKEKAA